jgi:hypothetical protein
MWSGNILSKYIIIIALFFCFVQEADSQLSLYIRRVTDAAYPTIDPWQFPVMKARLRAESAGSPVKLSPENILILENNKISKPYSVSEFQTDTTTGELWQLVKWYSRREGTNKTYNNNVVLIDTFFVFKDNEIGRIAGWYSRTDLSLVKIFNYKQEPLVDMEFKTGEPGSSQTVNIIVKAMQGMIDGSGSEGQIWLDSVKVHTDNFRIKWDGWSQDKRPPPLHIWSGMPYFVRLYYEPKDNEYHTDKFTVYYDHGLKSDIMLSGHEFYISDEANNLKLKYPAGDEFFTPCQEIEIKWDGYIPGMATYIDFSSNGGSSWTNIGLSDDSTFKWSIPNTGTSSGLIRVRQSFNSTYPVLLKTDDIPVHKIVFNYNGSGLLAANEAGVINLWNTATEQLDNQFFIDQPDYPSRRIIPTGMSYISGDSIFAVTYYRLYDYSRKDSVAFFHTKDSQPYLRVGLIEGFNTSEVHFDNEKRFMAFVPVLGMQIKIFSAVDGSFIKDLNFNKPVSAFVFNRELNQAAVATMDGIIRILQLPDFNSIKTLDYSDFPMILKMSIAPNGNYIALGTKASRNAVFESDRNDVVIVNIPGDQVIRRLRRTASDPVRLEFSPVSSKLLVGSESNPQITYWDLPVDESFNGFKGHEGRLTDFAFSPLGSMIATSSASSDNLYLRRFSYAESDENNSYFNILTPDLSIENIMLSSAYIAQSNDYTYNSSVCVNNDSPVYLSVDSVALKRGVHFHLIEPIPHDTIIEPGFCLSLSINYTPLDTGLLSDTIFVFSCGKKYEIHISSVGLNRNIRLLNDILEFDPTCIGEFQEKVFPLAVNDDPVPLLMNGLEIIKEDYTPFVNQTQREIIYQPGDTIFAKISFEPTRIGDAFGTMRVDHSSLRKFSFNVQLYGKGIGTEYSVSHNDLRFIPEILRRKITIKNISVNEITIKNAVIAPPGFFSVTGVLPVSLKEGEETELEIIWHNPNDSLPDNIVLTITAGPCAAEKRITLGRYKAFSRFIIPDVYADPNGETNIIFNYKNDENKSYNGIRFFEGEIIINPRLFLPLSVQCPYGTGELTRNEIYKNRRIIGFIVEGDFPAEGTAAVIHGIAGLAENDTSHINTLRGNSIWWGSAVEIEHALGVYHLINICGDRLVIHGNIITNILVKPNPNFGNAEIEFESSTAGNCVIEVYNNLGILEVSYSDFSAVKGHNSVKLDLTSLKSGTYSLFIKQGNSFGLIRMIILK